MEQIGKYSVMIFISSILCYIHYICESNYFSKFFIDNAILLGVTLFAIHAASIGILISQLVIINKTLPKKFLNTIKEIRKSFIEALFFLVIIIMCAILVNGNKEKVDAIFDIISMQYICYCLSLSSIMALLMIAFDSANAILVTFENISED